MDKKQKAALTKVIDTSVINPSKSSATRLAVPVKRFYAEFYGPFNNWAPDARQTILTIACGSHAHAACRQKQNFAFRKRIF